MTQLSPHFSLEELTITQHREFDNIPPDEQTMNNLIRLAHFMEDVKALFGGKALFINSAYRSLEVNNAVGSKPTSQHRTGTACDFHIDGLSPDDIIKQILASDLKFDQCIREFATPAGGGWTHISISNDPLIDVRMQALIIDKYGTRAYA